MFSMGFFVLAAAQVPESTVPGSCIDYDQNCNVYADVQMCGRTELQGYLNAACRRACGFCSAVTTTQTAATTPARTLCKPSDPFSWFQTGVNGRGYLGTNHGGNGPAERFLNVANAEECASICLSWTRAETANDDVKVNGSPAGSVTGGQTAGTIECAAFQYRKKTKYCDVMHTRAVDQGGPYTGGTNVWLVYDRLYQSECP